MSGPAMRTRLFATAVAIVLSASAAGAHMTGATITVDGGHSVNPL